MRTAALAFAVAAALGHSGAPSPYTPRFPVAPPTKKKPPEIEKRRAARKAAKKAKRRNRR